MEEGFAISKVSLWYIFGEATEHIFAKMMTQIKKWNPRINAQLFRAIKDFHSKDLCRIEEIFKSIVDPIFKEASFLLKTEGIEEYFNAFQSRMKSIFSHLIGALVPGSDDGNQVDVGENTIEMRANYCNKIANFLELIADHLKNHSTQENGYVFHLTTLVCDIKKMFPLEAASFSRSESCLLVNQASTPAFSLIPSLMILMNISAQKSWNILANQVLSTMRHLLNYSSLASPRDLDVVSLNPLDSYLGNSNFIEIQV